MSYDRVNWDENTALNPANLNVMDSGIERTHLRSMSEANRDSLSGDDLFTGRAIFNTDKETVDIYDGTQWLPVRTSPPTPMIFPTMGLIGEIPAATDHDVSSFFVIVPRNCTLTKIHASMRLAPSTDTTFQLRRSTDDGASFSSISTATVVVMSGDHVGVNDGFSITLNENELLNFSVTGGGNSGEDVMITVYSEVN